MTDCDFFSNLCITKYEGYFLSKVYLSIKTKLVKILSKTFVYFTAYVLSYFSI